MDKSLKLSFIGSGKVAEHLSFALENVGYIIEEIYSPNYSNAQVLSSKLYKAIPQSHLDFLQSKSTVFFICVKDSKIGEVVSNIKLPPDSFIAHTSGSVNLSILENNFNRCVFYPVQTFSKGIDIDFKNTPFCIEASNNETEKVFTQLAHSLGSSIHLLNSDKRKALHLSAVFACNFTNHLLGIASYILETQEIDTNILAPIIKSTFEKALNHSAFDVQTGPAVRKDYEILKKHQAMLEDLPFYKEIYLSISKSIIYEHNSKMEQ